MIVLFPLVKLCSFKHVHQHFGATRILNRTYYFCKNGPSFQATIIVILLQLQFKRYNIINIITCANVLWFSNKSFIGTVKPVSINKNNKVQYFVVIVRRTYLLLGGWYGIEWLWFSLDLAFCDWSTSLLLISGFWVGLIEILIGYGSENTIFH